MGWFSRKKSGASRSEAPLDRGADSADREHLQEFLKSRRGVEAYVEPATHATQTTVVLIAFDGEWTRRRIESPKAAAALARDAGIPIYDAAVVGYPQRMRDWTARNKDQRGTVS